MTTNGILYDNEKVQKFIHKNRNKLSIGMSIDGTKKKHDMQRVYPDGRGSYDDVIRNVPLWLKQFPFCTTKVTIGHDDLPYLKESIVHLWKIGCKTVPANVVFENVWTEGDDKIYEEQLKSLADYVIDNDLYKEYNCTLFSEHIGYPNDDEDLKKNFCGSGKMLAVDSDGNFYPCLRYMDYSLASDKPSYKVGNVAEGIDWNKLRPFYTISLEAQSKEECIECEVAQGCAWCQGNNYDSAETETNFQRNTAICKMHKARCRANEYYWNRLFNKTHIKRNILDAYKKHMYFIMSDDSVSFCNYDGKRVSDVQMNNETIEKALEFCERNFYAPVILHSKDKNKVSHYTDILSRHAYRTDIYSSSINLNSEGINSIPVYTETNYKSESPSNNCILVYSSEKIDKLYECIKELFVNVDRINLNIKFNCEKFQYDIYEEQLKKVSNVIFDYFKEDRYKELNIITDRLFINKMDNCNFGSDNFAIAPNGKIYICPAFYFNDPSSDIGNLKDGINMKNKQLFKLEQAPLCNKCDAYHCNRCVYQNKKYTSEYNVPSIEQCKISHIERNVSKELSEKLLKEGIEVNSIKSLTYSDPIELISMDQNIEIKFPKTC